MKEIECYVTDPMGLHMRPAAALAKLAHDYKSTIKIISKSGECADARAMLMTVRMGIKQSVPFTISIDGEDEDSVVSYLENLRGKL